MSITLALYAGALALLRPGSVIHGGTRNQPSLRPLSTSLGDGTLLMEVRDVILLLNVVAIFCFAYFIRVYIPHYLKRKGENLAQKEDIEALTAIVQRVETQFDKAKLVHRVQFEAEFRYYERVWRAADAVNASLCRVYQVYPMHEVTDELIKEFYTEQEKFARLLDSAKPFIVTEVWKTLNEYETIVIHGKSKFITGEAMGDIRQYREEVRHAYEACVEAIRLRLSSLLVV